MNQQGVKLKGCRPIHCDKAILTLLHRSQGGTMTSGKIHCRPQRYWSVTVIGTTIILLKRGTVMVKEIISLRSCILVDDNHLMEQVLQKIIKAQLFKFP
jgi:hypothetical protein